MRGTSRRGTMRGNESPRRDAYLPNLASCLDYVVVGVIPGSCNGRARR